MKISTNVLILIWSALVAVALIFLILWLSAFEKTTEGPILISPAADQAIAGEASGLEPGVTPTAGPSMIPVLQFSASTSAGPSTNATPGPLDPTAGAEQVPTLWPDGLVIGPWRDDSLMCDRNPTHKWVKIQGVQISGGIPPYDITFTQRGNIVALKRAEAAGEVVFVDPVVVAKGAPITVTLAFDSGRGYWEENLYYHYLDDPRCSN